MLFVSETEGKGMASSSNAETATLPLMRRKSDRSRRCFRTAATAAVLTLADEVRRPSSSDFRQSHRRVYRRTPRGSSTAIEHFWAVPSLSFAEQGPKAYRQRANHPHLNLEIGSIIILLHRRINRPCPLPPQPRPAATLLGHPTTHNCGLNLSQTSGP